MMKSYILFDLDGTLTDSALGITNSVAFALERFGIEVTERRELFQYIGPPLTYSFSQFHHLSKQDAIIALGYYREYFEEKGLFENKLYEGVIPMLAGLQERGFHLMVATSKPEEYSIQILERLGLASYFEFLCGNTLNENRPTKESVISNIMERYPSVNGSNSIMVGDREYDILGAHKCGLKAVGVLYGYGSRDELERAGADYIASDVASVGLILQNIFLPEAKLISPNII